MKPEIEEEKLLPLAQELSKSINEIMRNATKDRVISFQSTMEVLISAMTPLLLTEFIVGGMSSSVGDKKLGIEIIRDDFGPSLAKSVEDLYKLL